MGNRWSMVTFCIGKIHGYFFILYKIIIYNRTHIHITLVIYVRSPSAFEAVKSVNILQLPSKRTLESFTTANTHQPGVSNVNIIYVSNGEISAALLRRVKMKANRSR